MDTLYNLTENFYLIMNQTEFFPIIQNQKEIVSMLIFHPIWKETQMQFCESTYSPHTCNTGNFAEYFKIILIWIF